MSALKLLRNTIRNIFRWRSILRLQYLNFGITGLRLIEFGKICFSHSSRPNASIDVCYCALTNFSSLSATAASKIEIAFNFLQNPHRKVISNFQLGTR